MSIMCTKEKPKDFFQEERIYREGKGEREGKGREEKKNLEG